MPIRNFDEWEQAVLDKKMSTVQKELEESVSSPSTPRPPLSPLQFRLKKLGQLVIILSVVGGIFLIIVNQFPERLEPAFSFIEELYVGLLSR